MTDKIIPQNRINLGEEVNFVINGMYEHGPVLSHCAQDFLNMVAPVINGREELDSTKPVPLPGKESKDFFRPRSLHMHQAFGGDWYADIIDNKTGDKLISTPFPKPFAQAGCIAFLLWKGYKYNE